MQHRLNKTTLAWAVGLALGAAPGALLAAGFYIQEQSVSGLGRAFAGEAAIASDASTIYFNPAGMTRLKAPEFQAAVHLLVPKSTVSNSDSRAITPGTGGNPLPYEGGSGGNPYEPSPVPNLFYARPLNEQTWFGLGITAPFGLANEYDRNFFARYDSTETSLKVIDIAPSIAYQLNDRVSIGGGINIQYADATLKNALPDPTRVGGPSVDTDGEFALSGDSWDYGFNIGLLVDLSDDTRIGVHYRQGITHTLEGTATTRLPVGLGGTSVSQGGEADLKLPDMVSVGVSHRFTDRWTGLAQYTWFNWSNFDEIAVKLASGDHPDPVRQNYKNSWALALGAEYQLDDRWTLRGGIQYDTTPTQDGFRTTRTPDGDRTWFSAGASYERDSRLGFDLAYTYIDVAKESLNLDREFYDGLPFASSVELRGTTEGHVHILAAALRYRF
ncbi:OmpP1/FadL family transporter [Thioalkalivibrio sulfidiphilus]|uniref:OmpP1/FadL family transporter n=1 Tax=Thioalkalivibrio sulfidiphilus TaxID=1033854 RepID=UPI003B355C2C